MTIDWAHFTPGSALAGGILIWLAAAWLIEKTDTSWAPQGCSAASFRRARATGPGACRRWRG